MSLKTKFATLQEMIKRFKRLRVFSIIILIVDAGAVILLTEFTSWRTPDFYGFLSLLTVIAIASGFGVMSFAGIQAGLEKAHKLFKELE